MMSNSAASPNPTQSCAERLKSNWTKRQKWRPTATCLFWHFWPTQCTQLFISALSDFMWLDSLYPCCSLDTHNMEMLSGRLCNLCQPFVSCGSPSTAERWMITQSNHINKAISLPERTQELIQTFWSVICTSYLSESDMAHMIQPKTAGYPESNQSILSMWPVVSSNPDAKFSRIWSGWTDLVTIGSAQKGKHC